MRRNAFIILAVAFLVGLSLFSCTKEGKETNNKIVVGIHSWPGNGPLYVGHEKGYFNELGIEIEFNRIESFDNRRAALISGAIDIDCTTLDQLLILWESGFHSQVFGISDFSTGGDGVVAKNEIKTIEELRGKTVAYAEASPSDFFLRYLLNEKGINFSELELQPVADAQAAGTAILAEQVDAAVTFEPWLSESANNPNIHIIATTKEYPDLIPGIYIARSEDLKKREKLFRDFMKAWYKSVDYFENNPDEAKEIIARRMEISLDDLNSILSAITILDKSKIENEFDKNKNPNIYVLVDAISLFWKESGFTTKRYKPEDLILPLVEQTGN